VSILAFTVLAALAVWLAGRRDPARDPRLTTLVLVLLALVPLFPWLPKLELLPAPGGGGGAVAAPWWLLPLWAAGAAWSLLRVARDGWRVALWRRHSTLLSATVPGAPAATELRLLPGLRSPAAAGILRPVVFVPAEWPRWSAAERDAVLAHEAAHLGNRDPLRRLLAALACALHWYNPLVHWIARRLEAQCEFAADERVLAVGHAAGDYARLLCDFAARGRSPVPALAMARRGRLEQRVRHLFDEQPPRRRVVLGALIVSTVITAVGLAILGPAAPRQPVEPAEVRLRLSADPFPGN
jgi:hypothetical protein